MKKLLFIIILIPFMGFQQYKLTKVNIDKNLSIKLPIDFSPVAPAELASKYISYRTPIAFFSNSTKEVDFSINNSTSRWHASDLALIQSFYKSNISNLFDNAVFIREDIEEINNRSFIVFEFTASVTRDESVLRSSASENKYFYLQYTINDGQAYIFSFSAPKDQLNVWSPTAALIMRSVKMK